jgi:hypothetical protein
MLAPGPDLRLAIGVSNYGPEKYEPFPEGELIYKKSSMDHTVMLTVRLFNVLDIGQVDMNPNGAVNIYDTRTLQRLYHERHPLSGQFIDEYEPTDEEKSYWDELIGRFAADM